MWPGALTKGTVVRVVDPLTGRFTAVVAGAVLSWGFPFYLVERAGDGARYLVNPALTFPVEGGNVMLLRPPSVA